MMGGQAAWDAGWPRSENGANQKDGMLGCVDYLSHGQEGEAELPRIRRGDIICSASAVDVGK